LEESSLFIEKMSCKTEYAYCSLRNWQSELMIFVSAIAYRPTSLPFPEETKDRHIIHSADAIAFQDLVVFSEDGNVHGLMTLDHLENLGSFSRLIRNQETFP
jgi:hypothetical protein